MTLPCDLVGHDTGLSPQRPGFESPQGSFVLQKYTLAPVRAGCVTKGIKLCSYRCAPCSNAPNPRAYRPRDPSPPAPVRETHCAFRVRARPRRLPAQTLRSDQERVAACSAPCYYHTHNPYYRRGTHKEHEHRQGRSPERRLGSVQWRQIEVHRVYTNPDPLSHGRAGIPHTVCY